MVDGKNFRLADEVRYILRRAAEHDGRVVTISPPLRGKRRKMATPNKQPPVRGKPALWLTREGSRDGR